MKRIGLTSCNYLVPIVLYSGIQPLSIMELKKYYDAFNVAVITIKELIEFLRSPKTVMLERREFYKIKHKG